MITSSPLSEETPVNWKLMLKHGIVIALFATIATVLALLITHYDGAYTLDALNSFWEAERSPFGSYFLHTWRGFFVLSLLGAYLFLHTPLARSLRLYQRSLVLGVVLTALYLWTMGAYDGIVDMLTGDFGVGATLLQGLWQLVPGVLSIALSCWWVGKTTH